MTSLQQANAWKIHSEEINLDQQQEQVIALLQQLADHLRFQNNYRWKWWHRLKKILFIRKNQPSRGLYIWGSVGIGKTYLMDLFYASLPMKQKLRLHFHRFMASVHQQLTKLNGEKDPLQHVARHFAQRARVICFDEFFVDNIADAMLLGRLLQGLFNQGVCMVMTSNQAPDNLYPKGLQRRRFLATIELLNRHMAVVHMNSSHDYRTDKAVISQKSDKSSPTDEKLLQIFNQLSHGNGKANVTLTINQRPIETIYLAEQVVWFDFNQICNIPRSQNDYLAIAKRFQIVMMSEVPQIRAHEESKVAYLISLVDIFYDEGVELILSSEVELDQIYIAGGQLSEFQRTLSRLIEMQSLAVPVI